MAQVQLLPGLDGAKNRPQNLPESASENQGGKHLQSSNNLKLKWNGKMRGKKYF